MSSDIWVSTLTEKTKGRTGRAFVQASAFPHLRREELLQVAQEALDLRFYDDEETERLDLIYAALRRGGTIPVEFYPSEATPVSWEAYFRISVTSDDAPESVWGCILYPIAVVHEELKRPPYWFTETSVLQVVDDATSDAKALAALQAWVQRIWPELPSPNFDIERWHP